ncbi:MAG: hypothetical protein GX791_05705 [Synergistaceae bacterium]|nr:hypothetical protein [Synergistaceae bacterium]
MKDSFDNAVTCPECGSEVPGNFRFCPECGNEMPEIPPPTASPSAEELPPPSPARIRVNPDRTEKSFREFNAVARKRRRKDERRSILPLLLLFLILISSIGAGVFWFLKKAEEIPWDSAVIEKPVKNTGNGSVSPPPPVSPAPPAVQPGAVPPTLPAAPAAPAVPAGEIPKIMSPTRGIVIGSNVNLRGTHSTESPVVGKLSLGNRVEVLESWSSDEAAEAVTRTNLDLTAGGKTVKIPGGKGVHIVGTSATAGKVKITLPDDKAKTIYEVSEASLDDAWPWYRIKPKTGKEGWIFGKFLTVLDVKDNSLSESALEIPLTSFGTNRQELEQALGKPSKATPKKLTAAQGGGTEVTLVFPGATVVLHEKDEVSEVRSLALTSAKHPLDGGLAVDIARRDVLALLGLPNDIDKGAEIYRLDGNRGIRIVYEKYRVKSLVLGRLK